MEQARPPSTGQRPIDLALLREVFELCGEDVRRKSTGRMVRPGAGKYTSIFVCGPKVELSYHRLKFGLAHGYLPPEVDHKDGDTHNNTLGNLRASTHFTNNRNRANPRGRKHNLPRGVQHSGKRFTASIWKDGKQTHLGMFDTPGEASQVVEGELRELHGEFHHAPL